VGVAHERSIDLTGIEVQVGQKQNLSVSGPKDPKQRTLKMKRIRRHIRVTGNMSQQQVQELLWGAEHCPVSNTLQGGVDIVTEIEQLDSLGQPTLPR
jgi:uncharacterized OsmC-like protein